MYCTITQMRYTIGLVTFHRLTQAGFFLALTRPGFFRSTRRASKVTQPAVTFVSRAQCERELVAYLDVMLVSGPAPVPRALSRVPM